MTHRSQSNTTHEAVQLLADHGFDSMAQAIQILMNEAMKIESELFSVVSESVRLSLLDMLARVRDQAGDFDAESLAD